MIETIKHITIAFIIKRIVTIILYHYYDKIINLIIAITNKNIDMNTIVIY